MILLTERQRRQPHLTLRDARLGSLSVLERSFATRNLDEIEFWQNEGVVDEAMSGRARSRRNYSQTLMDRLLAGNSVLLYDPAAAARLDTVMQDLWARGARKHGSRYDQWLAGAIGYSVGHMLLDAGANPHITEKYNPVIGLFQHLASAQKARTEPRAFLTHAPQEIERLKGMVDRCLSVPCADKTVLNRYLGQVVLLGLQAPDEHQAQWVDWRERLLSLGALPEMGYESVWTSFATAGPGDANIPRYELDRRLRPESWYLEKDRELTPEEQEKARQWRQERDARWARVSEAWMDALVPHLPAARQAFPWRHLPIHDWMRLLVQPNGQTLVGRLLDAGVPAPWQLEDEAASAEHAFCTGGARQPGLVSRLRAVLASRPNRLDPKWIDTALNGYLSAPFAWQPSADSERSLLWPRIENHEKRTPMAVSELSEWMDLLRLQREDPLPAPLMRWVSMLPQAWSEDSRQQDQETLEFLVQRGVLDHALAPPAGHARWSRGDTGTFFQGGWCRHWLHHDQNRATLLARAPHLAIRVHALAATLAPTSQQRRTHLAALAQAAPITVADHCSVLSRAEVSDLVGWSSGLRQWQDKLLHCADLAAFGARLDEELLRPVLDKFLTAALNGSATAMLQVSCIEALAAMGYDFPAWADGSLEALLKREASLSASSADAMANLEPLVSAMFAAGADPSGLPQASTARPLSNLVAIEQERLRLEANTQVALAPARSRRL